MKTDEEKWLRDTETAMRSRTDVFLSPGQHVEHRVNVVRLIDKVRELDGEKLALEKRVEELDGKLSHSKWWNGIIGAAHSVICKANDQHHHRIQALESRVEELEGDLEFARQCGTDKAHIAEIATQRQDRIDELEQELGKARTGINAAVSSLKGGQADGVPTPQYIPEALCKLLPVCTDVIKGEAERPSKILADNKDANAT
jgi:DNA repair exonuclease SbcCD ATPase subunit